MLSRGTDRWSAYGRAGPPTGRAWSVLAVAAVIVGMLVLAASRPHVVGDRPVISYRPDQPGFRRLHGPLDRALARLSVPVRIPAAIGAPTGVPATRGRTSRASPRNARSATRMGWCGSPPASAAPSSPAGTARTASPWASAAPRWA